MSQHRNGPRRFKEKKKSLQGAHVRCYIWKGLDMYRANRGPSKSWPNGNRRPTDRYDIVYQPWERRKMQWPCCFCSCMHADAETTLSFFAKPRVGPTFQTVWQAAQGKGDDDPLMRRLVPIRTGLDHAKRLLNAAPTSVSSLWRHRKHSATQVAVEGGPSTPSSTPSTPHFSRKPKADTLESGVAKRLHATLQANDSNYAAGSPCHFSLITPFSRYHYTESLLAVILYCFFKISAIYDSCD